MQKRSATLAQLMVPASHALAAMQAGRSLTDALAEVPSLVRPGAQALSFIGARRWAGTSAVLALLAPRAPKEPIASLLRLTLALLWPGQAHGHAPHTLVSQAVDATKRLHQPSAKFVNAVLRGFMREQDAWVAKASASVSVNWEHPPWWIQRVQADWPNAWERLLMQAALHPPMALRVNARRGARDAYLGMLAKAGMQATAAEGSFQSQGLTLTQPCSVDELPGFAEGWVSVQDLGAQMAAPLLLGAGLAPHARVLDACAAPGGKTAHLLELADLDVTAIDVNEARLARVRQTLHRLGLQARLIAADASQPSTWWDGQPFDAILLDAPCSASGVVRRHPDIPWLRRASDIPALAALQARLLDALWPLLRPGGRLLYATCSVFKAEGQLQIDAFLQRQTHAPPVCLPSSPGHLLPLPDNSADSSAASPHDGFFYSLLQKR